MVVNINFYYNNTVEMISRKLLTRSQQIVINHINVIFVLIVAAIFPIFHVQIKHVVWIGIVVSVVVILFFNVISTFAQTERVCIRTIGRNYNFNINAIAFGSWILTWIVCLIQSYNEAIVSFQDHLL